VIVAFVPDLMDRSKVTAAAGAQPVRFVATPAELTHAVADADIAEGAGAVAHLVLVDLSRPGAIEAVAAVAALPTRRIVGFAPHVDHERLDEARAAGCTEVLARRDLFRRLDEVLAEPTGGGP
jgi:hypothetical protein